MHDIVHSDWCSQGVKTGLHQTAVSFAPPTPTPQLSYPAVKKYK